MRTVSAPSYHQSRHINDTSGQHVNARQYEGPGEPEIVSTASSKSNRSASNPAGTRHIVKHAELLRSPVTSLTACCSCCSPLLLPPSKHAMSPPNWPVQPGTAGPHSYLRRQLLHYLRNCCCCCRLQLAYASEHVRTCGCCSCHHCLSCFQAGAYHSLQ